ncbi:uncharacterized protein OCT59_015283 [Rhizophagus irregularis]|uniref:uncharacterized protein n=1 Tax=Rhizophagus irregularis TaxID=588596 RepID=UPI00331AF776|nr:hypothetical protein OCT59_015283 [Rhizophagus irregularis]
MPVSVDIDNLFNWTEENFIELGKIISDFIPLIRWVQISPKLFYQKIFPFKRLFPENIFDDIVGYYIDPDSLPKSIILLQPRKPSFSSEIINKKHFAIISSWIDKENKYYEIKNIPYSFELLYSATKDGFDSTRSPIITRAVNLNSSSSIHDPDFINLFDLFIKDNTLECNSTSSFPGTKFFINVGQKFLMEDYEVFKITKLSKLIKNEKITKSQVNLTTEFIIAKHKIDKISSFVKFTLQECAKILVNTFGRINSIMKFSVQICANFIFQVYSIIKYTLRKCAEILFDTMKFIFRRCSDIVFQICSIMKFGVRSCAYFIFQVYSIIKNTLQECAKILFNTIKIIFQRCTDVVYKIYSIIKFIFQRCADIIFTTYLITNFTFQICITIIFQSYSIIKFTFRKCIDILYTIFQKGKFYSVIKFMSTIAIFQGCANIVIILYQRDKINSIVKFASIPIVSLTSTSTVISSSISINLSFQYT